MSNCHTPLCLSVRNLWSLVAYFCIVHRRVTVVASSHVDVSTHVTFHSTMERKVSYRKATFCLQAFLIARYRLYDRFYVKRMRDFQHFFYFFVEGYQYDKKNNLIIIRTII